MMGPSSLDESSSFVVRWVTRSVCAERRSASAPARVRCFSCAARDFGHGEGVVVVRIVVGVARARRGRSPRAVVTKVSYSYPLCEFQYVDVTLNVCTITLYLIY